MDGRYRKDPGIVSRIVAGEVILVPIRNCVEDLDCIYSLGGTGARIWELIDGQRSLQEIGSLMAEEFEISRQDVERDLVEYVGQLETIGALTVV